MQCDSNERPSFPKIIGFFGLAALIGLVMSRLGLFPAGLAVAGSVSVASAFLIGLVAASSSCLAVTGGLLLATAAKYSERIGPHATRRARIVPIALFIVGRVVAYAALGALIGQIGNALAPSPTVSGIITLAAAALMLVIGLDMLKLLPSWAKRFVPRAPAAVSRRIMRSESSVHAAAPLLLGAGTFFLPCGFTQALQLYALATASPIAGALTLGSFALGTAPALFALGYFAGALKGNSGRFLFRLAGAAIVLLGAVNFRNGANLLGWPPASRADVGPVVQSDGRPGWVTPGEPYSVAMAIGPGGYSPSSLEVPAGAKVIWRIDATHAAGCAMAIVSRSLGIQQYLSAGDNEISFTAPERPGTYSFSCPMGMYRGEFVVTKS
jgi:uncharacterized protein